MVGAEISWWWVLKLAGGGWGSKTLTSIDLSRQRQKEFNCFIYVNCTTTEKWKLRFSRASRVKLKTFQGDMKISMGIFSKIFPLRAFGHTRSEHRMVGSIVWEASQEGITEHKKYYRK